MGHYRQISLFRRVTELIIVLNADNGFALDAENTSQKPASNAARH
jgi:hypothetical protein